MPPDYADFDISELTFDECLFGTLSFKDRNHKIWCISRYLGLYPLFANCPTIHKLHPLEIPGIIVKNYIRYGEVLVRYNRIFYRVTDSGWNC